MKSLLTVVLITLTTIAVQAQNDKTDFKSIDLKNLKQVFVKELIKDGLIAKKNEEVHLVLKQDETVLNDKMLTEKFHEKYGNLASDFGIKQGPNRVIYSTKNCIAVGDFVNDSFSGRVQGSMDLDELKVSMR